MGAPAGVTGLKRLLLTLALIITLAAGSVSCTTGGGSTPDDQPTVAHVNRRSIGERLARESLRLADTEPRLSVLFALEAAALTQSPLVADALNRLRSPHPVTHFRLGSAPVRTLRFSTDGRLLIGASTNGDVRVWDTYTGRTRLSARLEGPVTDAVVDYPSDLAAARSATGEVRVWHLDTGRLARRFDAAPGRAGGLVFVPGQLEKDLLAFSGRHGSIEVWDTGDWHRKAKLHPTGGSADLTWFADGDLVPVLATLSRHGDVEAWNPNNGKHLGKIHVPLTDRGLRSSLDAYVNGDDLAVVSDGAATWLILLRNLVIDGWSTPEYAPLDTARGMATLYEGGKWF